MMWLILIDNVSSAIPPSSAFPNQVRFDCGFALTSAFKQNPLPPCCGFQ
jgi:hypothetical protein